MNQLRHLLNLLEQFDKEDKPNLGKKDWEELQYLKDESLQVGNQLAASGYQLYMPNPVKMPKSTQEKRRSMFADPSAWADDGNLDPASEKYVYGNNDISPNGINESAPIIGPSRTNVPPGRNKPHAQLWTSTATKNRNGSWSSEWVDWCEYEAPEWMAPKGYLYKVKPGARILRLNEMSAEELYLIFTGQRLNSKIITNSDFPWDKINNHFDAVHMSKKDIGQGFTYGWDVESTAWFDPSFLTLVGEVPIKQGELK